MNKNLRRFEYTILIILLVVIIFTDVLAYYKIVDFDIFDSIGFSRSSSVSGKISTKSIGAISSMRALR